ncbi:EF-hand domain-containing family member B [Lonchura striata]|uniref:EF-hand domain-containing family member B n=1 Tax=Lonchura striata TaxID=40157 RepID=A0A218VF87_9PASE|nr:EF-hand domain-containing family member B [Lonchura striata domestica]
MAEQPRTCPEETLPHGTREVPNVSAFAKEVPPIPLSLLSGAESRRRKGLEEGRRVGGEGASPSQPLRSQNGGGSFPPPSKRAHLDNVPCVVSDPNLTSCVYYYEPVTPIAVRKFRNTTDPAPGAKIIFYGSAGDPDVATHLTHGIKSTSKFTVASLVSPVAKSEFQEKMQDMKEAIYSSNREAPLGKSHDQSLKLPEGLDIINTTFGVKVFKDLTAGELVNPPKTFEEVDTEAREGHDLYVLSHEDYYVGESVNRKYNSHFDKSSVYGMETPHYEDGRNTAKTLNWVLDLDSKRAPHLVSIQSDDFKEKYQPLVGKALDPIAETMNVPRDHTFGLVTPPDEYVRESLKKADYRNFDVLLEALKHFDKNGDGTIHKDNLRKIFFQLNMNLDDELLESLFDCCDLDKDGLINYWDFANFLNWKDKMGVKEFEEKIITKGKKLDAYLPKDTKKEDKPLPEQEDLELKEPETSEKMSKPLTRSTDRVYTNYQTSSSQYNAVVGGIPTSCYPLCGVPSIRSDIPAPRVCRLSDTTNYGDQGNSFSVMFPSVFSQKGVYEKDLLKKRPKAEIKQVLHNMGLNAADERFEEVWKQVCTKHEIKELCDCEESMWNILNKIHESGIKF